MRIIKDPVKTIGELVWDEVFRFHRFCVEQNKRKYEQTISLGRIIGIDLKLTMEFNKMMDK